MDKIMSLIMSVDWASITFKEWMMIFVGVICVWLLLRFTLHIVRFLFHIHESKDMVYMKITMPRKDSQKDKEKQEEKDFKEIVAVMSQLNRNLHEINELTLMNRIKSKILHTDTFSYEYAVRNKVLEFFVGCKKYHADLIEKQITSYYPDADIQFEKRFTMEQKGMHTKYYYVYLTKNSYFPIKTFRVLENDPLNDLTNVLTKLGDKEIAAIQVVLKPNVTGWEKKAMKFGTAFFKGKKLNDGFLSKIPILGALSSLITYLFFGYEKMRELEPVDNGQDGYVRMLQAKEEVAKAIGEKANSVVYDAMIRIAVTADTSSRADMLISNLSMAFNLFKNPESNYFQIRRIIFIDFINNFFMRFNFYHRLMSFGEKQSVMGTDELASVYHFPSGRYNYTPIIKWLAYKVLSAPTNTPKEGIVLGTNTYRGEVRKIRMLRDDRTRHHYIIGKSGAGKSALLSYMARQDIANGDGVCVVDPHGDLIEDILQYVPKERVKDVILFDPADQSRPVGLNMLEADTPEEMDMASSQATEIFIKLFGDEIFGPRIQHYFRNACLTLMEDKEGATLIDIPRLFTDEAFMKYKVAKTKNPVVRSFWDHEYANTGQRERQEMIPYFSSKFGPFITNSVMRNTIGQVKSGFNFRDVMDQRKILLINLSKGKIGDLNTQLLGLIVVAKIQMAAMSRVDTPEADRHDFYLYVDEFQNFATDSFCSILSEARKYRLALIMAHQYIKQLEKKGDTSIRDAVFGNVGTMMSFKVGAEDADYLSKEYAPLLSEQDILGIANYKAYIKLNIKNTTSRPFSLETIWDPDGANKKIKEVAKKYSKLKYGRKYEFVDQEIRARIGIEASSQAEKKPEVGATQQ